ncbi:flavin reductase family protein, partial [Streptomyces mutabilis]
MTATPGLTASPLATADLLRSVFRRHAAGVAVITARGDAGPVGFTATSLTSVSTEPPLLSFGIGTGSSSWPTVCEAEYVGVHVLGEHQQDLATTFARSGADRFAAPTAWREGPEGVPVLDGVLAWLVCRVGGPRAPRAPPRRGGRGVGGGPPPAGPPPRVQPRGV